MYSGRSSRLSDLEPHHRKVRHMVFHIFSRPTGLINKKLEAPPRPYHGRGPSGGRLFWVMIRSSLLTFTSREKKPWAPTTDHKDSDIIMKIMLFFSKGSSNTDETTAPTTKHPLLGELRGGNNLGRDICSCCGRL